MTIEHIFTYGVSGLPTAGALTDIVLRVGPISLATIIFATALEKISSRTACISAALVIVAVVATPLTASGIHRDNGPNKTEASTVWLEETHGLTLVAGSTQGEGHTEGFLENRIVTATDAAGNLHTIQLLPVDSNHTALVDGEPASQDSSYYLADPETGEEFNLEDTTK